MDMWRYYEVTHSGHDVMNPSSPDRLDELADALALGADARVLDLGCGHAEMLLRWHERRGVTGVGVDASPYAIQRARERKEARAPRADIALVHGRGEDFRTEERFDAACCIGASWIFGGHAGTLTALRALAKPGGAVVVGEPYWREEPPAAYLQAEGLERTQFHDLAGCLQVARGLDLELVWLAGSDVAEWDRYEMRQAAAVDAFARAHPEDEDLEEIRALRRKYDESYVRWGRACLGWALWAFRAPGAGA
jgi:SAM-dependent methyltransferase